jgi:hypothetical protein
MLAAYLKPSSNFLTAEIGLSADAEAAFYAL